MIKKIKNWVVMAFSFIAILACNSPTTDSCTKASTAGPQTAKLSSHRMSNSHIPHSVAALKDRGKTQADKTLSVTISLNLNNEAALDQKLSDLYSPNRVGPREFLTPESFRAQYAPSQAQVDDVITYLKGRGLTNISLNANGYLLRATGPVKALNRAFETDIHEYQDNVGKGYFAPAVEPKMPQGLAIRSVIGLHNVTKLRSHSVRSKTVRASASGPSGLTPSDIRKAYHVPANADGMGQTLALVELDGYTASDITAYENAFGLTNTPLENILVDGFNGSAGDGAIEVTLDIELMIAMAPRINKIYVYESPNTDTGLLDLFAKIANDNLAKQVSTSWGAPEEQQSSAFIQTENTIFKQMAAQGQSFFAASGDSGANDNGKSLSVDDPSSQPYVVGVGGTRLKIDSGNYVSETVWHTSSQGAGGGGISTIWPQPAFQNGVFKINNGFSATMRNVPDVALNADPGTGYAVYFQRGWTIVGGTSCGSPLWAGFTALVNQQRAASGYDPLGFPSPALYAIGKSAKFNTDFHDIADMSTNQFYNATPGFDDATGLGTINGTSLFEDLTLQDAGLSLPPVPVTSPLPNCS